MEQRDLIKDQIEQMGKVLAKILSDFLKLKSNGSIVQGVEISNERLQSELNIDIEEIITSTKTELKDYFNNRKLTEEHLDVLSDYLTEIGLGKLETDKTMAERYLKKAVELLDMADDISKSLSFGRIDKKSRILDVL